MCVFLNFHIYILSYFLFGPSHKKYSFQTFSVLVPTKLFLLFKLVQQNTSLISVPASRNEGCKSLFTWGSQREKYLTS